MGAPSWTSRVWGGVGGVGGWVGGVGLQVKDVAAAYGVDLDAMILLNRHFKASGDARAEGQGRARAGRAPC